ncbi:MAG: hypothetical protein J0I06_20870 [Planctomycetes bacterium]|nr:hypothetical protein [Planctomycetota bacterium]
MSDVRIIQLVAREGVLAEILENYPFPTASHRGVIELLYKETVDEMGSLGLVKVRSTPRSEDSRSSPGEGA